MADTKYLNDPFNVMSQFADLSELESSSDENTEITDDSKQKEKNKTNEETAENGTKDIIHPSIPKNNNSQFDLSQFQDLSLLESSSDEEINIDKVLYTNSTPKQTEQKNGQNHSKAALKNIKNTKKTNKLSQKMATSVVKGMIGVTSKINSMQTKKSQKIDKNKKIALKMAKNQIDEKSNDQSAENETNTCPFHKILIFAMHLHCVGHIFPQWVVSILNLFNDSELKSCHEAASLGQHQRKLFLDTIRECKEPEAFIFVDTDEWIEFSADSNSNYALVNVTSDNAKYSDLKSINGHKLNEQITNNHLMIDQGVYLFFNRIYKRQYLDLFLYDKDSEINYFCVEYRLQQRAHIKKILKLDFEIGEEYGDFFLNVYDKYLLQFDVNDCYESLSQNIGFWKELILNKAAMNKQYFVDKTFVVKDVHCREWIDDTQRTHCSYSKCNVKYNVVNRKHHCRSCGDIFCKMHCMKELYRRNEALEMKIDRQVVMNGMDDMSMMMHDDDYYANEREMRICPDCKLKKYLFVDIPHKHEFMNCKCLNWSVHDIDFEQQWKIFKSQQNEY